MKNFYYLYKGYIEQGCNPDFEEYFKMQQTIKKDFERLSYLFEEYENSEELINELKNVSENIENIFNNNGLKFDSEFLTSLSSMYLYFNYADKKEDDYDFMTVVTTRDFKEFYVVRENYIDRNTTIKKFKITGKKVENTKYNVKHFPVLFASDISVYSSINKLKELTPVNS